MEHGRVIVGGHICLDVIPKLHGRGFKFIPGGLEEIGAATINTGGCVANTGVALSRLGATVELVSRVGDDVLGNLLLACLQQQGADSSSIVRAKGEHTSYSVIMSPLNSDRMVLHYSGANDTFSASDLTEAFRKTGTLFHFGYPPLMSEMHRNGGLALEHVFRLAKSAGLVTSLDMAYPDPTTEAGRADWKTILRKTLPNVDVFLPSYEEICGMLFGHSESLPSLKAGANHPLCEQLEKICSILIEMGAPISIIKLGSLGIYVRTAKKAMLSKVGHLLDVDAWADRQLWTTVYKTDAISTNGAGDATIAGFLYGLVNHFGPYRTCTAACAVGGFSVESQDATSSIPHWNVVEQRLAGKWEKRFLHYLSSWQEIDDGVWAGPLDASCTRCS